MRPSKSIRPITRRDAIKASIGAGAGFMLGAQNISIAADESSTTAPARRPGGLRFAHLTDMHVQPELRGGEGYAAALQSLKKLDPAPAFIMTGGDHVMDAFGQTPDRCALQWDLYQNAMRENVSIPVHSAMGNHDVCGWGDAGKFPHETPGYGKLMGMQRLALQNPWYGFDAGDWRFIVLDSVAKRGKGYLGHLGDQQTTWLAEELARVGKTRPICVISHLPILSVCVYFDGDLLRETSWQVPDAWMHRDAGEIGSLIDAYNVRLLLSGHIHLVDRCEYRGKTYLCDGAVCGAWWKGSYNGCPEGYGVIDLWPDGSFEHQYVTYGWKAQTT